MESYKAKQQALDDIIDRARIGKCWNKHDDRWADAADVSLKTLQRFWDRQPIRKSNFINICEAVGIDDWEAIADSAPSSPVTSLPRLTPDWVEREDITESLLSRLQPPRRVLVLSGITGIGKTELVKRLLPELEDDKKYCSLNLDDGSLTGDFATSGAVLLRALGTEPTLEDQKDAKTLLAHIVDRLCQTPYRVQIDSLERILKGNETEGWSDFEDDLWLELFQQILAKNSCHSQLLVTTQDVPGELETVGSRYPQLWHCETLAGLSEEEQLELFANLGLGSVLDAGGEGADLLTRLGRLYEGHPLVLRVIAEDIKACGGDVARYWQQGKFAELEEQRSVRFSRRRLQTEVRERVRQSLERLPEAALRLLCRGAVYRRPVPDGFWLALLPEVGEAEKLAALDLLKARGLALEVWEPDAWLGADDAVPLRQHNLIRQVAYGLLQRDREAWQQVEQGAAAQWLAGYEPKEGVERLETVRGYLEAFDHYCDAEEWCLATSILVEKVNEDVRLRHKLFQWGYWKKCIQMHEKAVENTCEGHNILFVDFLANSYFCLGKRDRAFSIWQNILNSFESERFPNCDFRDMQILYLTNIGCCYAESKKYEEAEKIFQKIWNITRTPDFREWHNSWKSERHSAYHLAVTLIYLNKLEEATEILSNYLELSQKNQDYKGEQYFLRGFGLLFENTDNLVEAFCYYKKSLKIANQKSDIRGQANSLFHMAKVQYLRNKYRTSLALFQKSLSICRETEQYSDVAEVLNYLADISVKIGDLSQAMEYCMEAQKIATDLGIPLAKECEVLRSQIQMAQSPKNGGEET